MVNLDRPTLPGIETRRAVWRLRMQGKTMREVAEELEISMVTVNKYTSDRRAELNKKGGHMEWNKIKAKAWNKARREKKKKEQLEMEGKESNDK